MIQGLVGGIPYRDLGKTSLRETQLRYLAARHRVELESKTAIEIKMTEVSGRELARNKRVQEDGDPSDKRDDKEKAQDKADDERGKGLLADYRLSLEFPSWAPHHQAAYVRRYGWPGENPVAALGPYAGMTSDAALGVLNLMRSSKLDSFDVFWDQVPPEAEDRLVATVKAQSAAS